MCFNVVLFFWFGFCWFCCVGGFCLFVFPGRTRIYSLFIFFIYIASFSPVSPPFLFSCKDCGYFYPLISVCDPKPFSGWSLSRGSRLRWWGGMPDPSPQGSATGTRLQIWHRAPIPPYRNEPPWRGIIYCYLIFLANLLFSMFSSPLTFPLVLTVNVLITKMPINARVLKLMISVEFEA